MNKGRRIVFDEEGFIAEGEDVAQDIASKSRDYSETVEVVNMPAKLRERIKENRVRADQTGQGRGYVTKIYEALSRESSRTGVRRAIPVHHLKAWHKTALKAAKATKAGA